MKAGWVVILVVILFNIIVFYLSYQIRSNLFNK